MFVSVLINSGMGFHIIDPKQQAVQDIGLQKIPFHYIYEPQIIFCDKLCVNKLLQQIYCIIMSERYFNRIR